MNHVRGVSWFSPRALSSDANLWGPGEARAQFQAHSVSAARFQQITSLCRRDFSISQRRNEWIKGPADAEWSGPFWNKLAILFLYLISSRWERLLARNSLPTMGRSTLLPQQWHLLYRGAHPLSEKEQRAKKGPLEEKQALTVFSPLYRKIVSLFLVVIMQGGDFRQCLLDSSVWSSAPWIINISQCQKPLRLFIPATLKVACVLWSSFRLHKSRLLQAPPPFMIPRERDTKVYISRDYFKILIL